MSVEERLRNDAEHLAHEAAGLDLDSLFARVATTLATGGDRRVDDEAIMSEADEAIDPEACLPPGDDDLTPLEEIRFHMAHALRSASCARRSAELFDLLGNRRMAAICWEYAAAEGDADAQDYVSEFIAVSLPTPSADTSRVQFAELVRTYQ